jgi:hypothetical protein
VRIRYICSCVPVPVSIDVPDARDGVTLREWINLVCFPCANADHSTLGNGCKNTSVEKLVLPAMQSYRTGIILDGIKPRSAR